MNYCQSCSMPIDGPDLMGTEKDGSHNPEYCKFCYRNGAFVHPDLTYQDMQHRLTNQMKSESISPKEIEAAIQRLPELKRWKIKG